MKKLDGYIDVWVRLAMPWSDNQLSSELKGLFNSLYRTYANAAHAASAQIAQGIK